VRSAAGAGRALTRQATNARELMKSRKRKERERLRREEEIRKRHESAERNWSLITISAQFAGELRTRRKEQHAENDGLGATVLRAAGGLMRFPLALLQHGRHRARDVTEDAEWETEEERTSRESNGDSDDELALVAFFRDDWAPCVLRRRRCIISFFGAVFAAAVVISYLYLSPDTEGPNALPITNQYRRFAPVLVDHFVRTQSPFAIKLHLVHGIIPDDPIDRRGTVDTDMLDYGQPRYAGCDTFDPTTVRAQLWQLSVCHDAFFGNGTSLHGSNETDFSDGGLMGPTARKVLERGRVEKTEEHYHDVVTCPMQGFRDWLLTENGCTSLHDHGLDCANVTATRPNCVYWAEEEGMSCEPFPVPSADFEGLMIDFLSDDKRIGKFGETTYDLYKDNVLVDFANESVAADYGYAVQSNGAQVGVTSEDDDGNAEDGNLTNVACRLFRRENDPQAPLVVLRGLVTSLALTQEITVDYRDGIALYRLWSGWLEQMRDVAPKEMQASMHATNIAWSFYFLNRTLIYETYMSVLVSLFLCLVVLSIATKNVIMAFWSVFTIMLIVMDIFMFTVLFGYSLGILEAVNYVVVIGMSIDYCVHMSEAYTEAIHHTAVPNAHRLRDREERVVAMLAEMAVSVISGAISTVGCMSFLLICPLTFFVKFGFFVCTTICLSCIYSLIFFPALLATIGPEHGTGDLNVMYRQYCRSSSHADPRARSRRRVRI